MPKYTSYTSGNDSTGTGTLLNPYKTIRKLVDNLSAQDTGYVRGATYPDIRADNSSSNDTFYNLASGSGGNYTTIKAYENEPVLFKSLSTTSAMIGLRNTWTYLSFEDIEWEGNGQGGSTYQVFMKRLDPSYSGSFIKVSNCHIHDIRAHAVLLGGYTDCQFLDLLVHNCGFSGQEHGFYINNASDRCTIAGTTIHTVSGWGIQHDSTAGSSDDCRYYNNEIYNYGTSGVGGAGSGILLGVGDGNWAWNNIIHHGAVGTSDSGLTTRYGGTVTNSRFVNNLVYKARGYGMDLLSGTGHLAQNNIIIECGNTILQGTATLVTNLTSGTGTAIWEDPDTAYDFHLLSTASGARGAGTRHADFLTDKDGVSRSSPCDIGPYEYGSGSFPPSNVIPTARTTQVNVAYSFSNFNVSHNGDLTKVIIYAQSGSFS